MDAKISPDQGSNISGIGLASLLAFSLSTSALILDWLGNRLPWHTVSLTMPFLLCAVGAAAAGNWVIPLLQALKTGQIIREDGPQAHLRKAGTPTMGGVFFIPVGVMIACILSNFAQDVVAVSGLTLSYGLIGWIDDWQILRRKSNKGISPKMKLALQIIFAACFCLWMMLNRDFSITNIALPWVSFSLPLGLMFWPLAGFVLVAESNATNLTDGIDGLAGGTVAIAIFALGAVIAPTSPDLMIFCAAVSGSCLGFLAHNRNPARVFMGDTGSLALGGALAAVALLTNSLVALFILSGIFFVETLSVMAQVSYYKATKGPDGKGKRLFKMAPLHHHLELTGWSELQVVTVFYIIAAILATICLTIIKF
ncbi:phospho-N-acetylmuramoyl-pentapeptide-transferase [Anabaena cylindrica FACHB-243]|uniref:phospho-N-acetylmuramoyl-pentapeptide- transferase n=1 Tax=Anabaena TaxID=1163 RepID=UPI001495066F|nr:MULTISPECIES: phospho-N-acetylmuramoyl-pentapeptide-transferase [Anabaena]MBD2421439.1 phospho-N-acetylmuramoyl-pentapeptide-transferase [Anabaena cylindrica FACHB-243]MBY5283150.1 phospho-N-acetylmuramoyl-pentapeptide-transferase [Anabaena sp. CCAP 1446/1C]MBY5309130.1 phospho-N-acetylmuramoyl-pentapeptide-transferase [Anabaena sp. CCAP 1446/1C]MCM2407800.1 phospho-N-acetylmuramoyl-pentapeptide-transferase [Anabaena sp. CCAP 1446/1C]